MKAKIITPDQGRWLDVLGIDHKVQLAAADTEGAYTLVEIVSSPGLGIPPHVHRNEDETFHVVEGSVVFQVDRERVVATAGTTIHLPRGVPHAFTVEHLPIARMLLFIRPAGLERMLEELDALSGGIPDMAKVRDIVGAHEIAFL